MKARPKNRPENMRNDTHESLKGLSLEELWQLFPIVLTAHRAEWAEWYEQEAETLKKELPRLLRISHIGSTAIRGMRAKPTVDLLAEVAPGQKLADLKAPVEGCGYLCMAETDRRIDFNKGYTPQGYAERVFHLHLRHAGDNDELYFRDYLRTHAAAARAYERLKVDSARRYEHDRDAYTRCKSEFVTFYTQEGRRLFAGKYDL